MTRLSIPTSPAYKLEMLKRSKIKAEREAKANAKAKKARKRSKGVLQHIVVPDECSAEGLPLTLMRMSQRIEALEADNNRLRHGINPANCVQYPESARARMIQRLPGGKCTFQAFKHGLPWDFADDKILTNSIGVGNNDLVTIGAALGRTPFAVFAQLVKLGKVNEVNCYKMWKQVVEKGYTHV